MPTVLQALLDGVVLTESRSRESGAMERSGVLPFPDVVSLTGQHFKVRPLAKGEVPHVSFANSEVAVPDDAGAAAATIRLHEVGHVKYSRPSALVQLMNEKIDPDGFQAVEDARIEFLLGRDPELKKVLKKGSATMFSRRRLRNNVNTYVRNTRFQREQAAHGVLHAISAVEGTIAGFSKAMMLMGVCRASTNPDFTDECIAAIHTICGDEYSDFAKVCEAKMREVLAQVQHGAATSDDAVSAARELDRFFKSDESKPKPNGTDGESDDDARDKAIEEHLDRGGYEEGSVQRERHKEAWQKNLESGSRRWAADVAAEVFDPKARKGNLELKKEAVKLQEMMVAEGVPDMPVEELLARKSMEPPHTPPTFSRHTPTPTGKTLGLWALSSPDAVPSRKEDWAPMKVHTPPLSVKLPREVGKRGRQARDRGGQLRNVMRARVDGKPFVVKQKGRQRVGAILLDLSGSMSVTNEQIERAVQECPQAVIAGYAGCGRSGNLVVLARDGRRVDDASRASRTFCPGGQNACDGPALEWIAAEARRHKGVAVWVSDGWASFKGDSYFDDAVIYAQRLCERHHIHRVPSFGVLFNEYDEYLELYEGRR